MTNLISHGVFNPIKTGLPPSQIRKYKSYGNDASRIDSTYKYVNIL